MNEYAEALLLSILGAVFGFLAALVGDEVAINADCQKYGQHVQGEWRMTCVKEIAK